MANTALIIVDMLRDFTDPKGLVYYPQNRDILPKVKIVLDKCREHDKLIIFLQHFNRKYKIDQKAKNMRINCIEDSWGDEIDPALHIDIEKDYVIKKRRYSGFFATDLDLVLRENNIQNIILVGTKTNCCIRATIQDAFNLNYNPYVISDCVATDSEVTNDVHLQDIKKYFGKVIHMQEVFNLLEQNIL